jgi:hypothetical protein
VGEENLGSGISTLGTGTVAATGSIFTSPIFAACGGAAGSAARANENSELSRTAANAKRRHDTAAMMWIEERRKWASEARLSRMLSRDSGYE